MVYYIFCTNHFIIPVVIYTPVLDLLDKREGLQMSAGGKITIPPFKYVYSVYIYIYIYIII